MNDLNSKCGIPGLRAAAGFVAALALAGTAFGQTTALTINGQTAGNNQLTLNATVGSTLSVKIDNVAQANRPYGLFVALEDNNATTGWYLAVNGGGKKPMPVVTGVATSVVEANYPPVDISPDRPFNPNVHLDSGGHLNVSFLVPNSVVGQTYTFQAVVLKTGSSTATDVSNAIAVTFGAPTTAARVVCSLATAGSPTFSDHAGFGILQFTNGTPSSGVYTADPVLLDIKVDSIAMGDMNPWALHSINGNSGSRRPRDVGWQGSKVPAFNADNYEYGRIELPPLPGSDGILGTSDDIPARSVMRCYDNVSQQGFFLIVNKGPNPNVPGVDYYVIGRKKDTLTPTANSWRIALAFSPDGSRMSAIYDDTGVGITPQMFLIATDCSKPFTDSIGNLTDIIDVTPSGTNQLFVKGQIFTNNRLWFSRDNGQNTDGGVGNDVDRQLFTVNIRTTGTPPVPQQVAIPLSPVYSNPQVDQIPDKAFVVGRDGATLCFIAGNVFVPGSTTGPPTPDNVTFGDWYAVTELKPTQAVNLTTFPLWGAGVPANVYTAGDAYNGQSGYAVLSPDGSKFALTVQQGTESTNTEEVYIYTTKDLNGDNVGDDAGATKFNNPITNSGNFNHAVQALKKTADLYMSDNDHLYFYYGAWNLLATKEMDLFSWDDSTKVIANLTQTGGKTFPIQVKGTIYPEGYFTSPNGKYLIWSRASSSLSKTNLVAVELATGKLINVTGDEFGGAKTSNTGNPSATFGENFDWHLSFAGGAYPSLCFFSTNIDGTVGAPRNPWVFDANFPTTAIQLTNDTTSNQVVESLTPSPVSLGCAWGWCSVTTRASDMEYQDLLYYFRDDLTETSRSGSLPLSQFFWLRAGNAGDTTGAAPPALIAGFGDENISNDIDNPHDGKFYYFSLNGTTNYKFNQTTGVDAPGHQIGTTTGVICIYAVQKP